MATEKIKFQEFLKEAIRHRYATKSLLSNDNDFLTEAFDINVNLENKVIFNPNIVPLLGGDYNSFQIPEYIGSKGFWKTMEVMGIEKGILKEESFKSKNLKDLIKKVNNKKLKVCFIGYGGMSTNVLYNLNIINLATNMPIFNDVQIFENDNWALTNLFRIGKPMIHKTFSRFEEDFFEDESCPKIFTIDDEKRVAENFFEVNKKYLEENEARKMIEEGYLFIGAPDFKTRKMLQEIGANFIMIGHSGNGVRITKNPIIQSGAVTETYGSIDISTLLMNLWGATFKLLPILAKKDIEEIEDDEELFKFNFDDINQNEIKEIREMFNEELKIKEENFEDFFIEEDFEDDEELLEITE